MSQPTAVPESRPLPDGVRHHPGPSRFAGPTATTWYVAFALSRAFGGAANSFSPPAVIAGFASLYSTAGPGSPERSSRTVTA